MSQDFTAADPHLCTDTSPSSTRSTGSTPRSSSTSRPTTTSTTASAGPPGSPSSRSAAGPEPRPDWVVTSQGAIDTELGILKTGKEADVFLRRAGRPGRPRRRRRDGRQALPQQPSTAPSTAPRPTPRAAAIEALPRRARPQAQEHARAAWSRPASGRSRSGTRSSGSGTLGLPVPYPVQIDGTEILMEWITVDGETAPAAGPDPAGPGAAGVVLRPAARRAGHDGAGTASCTATSRRTTSSPPASAW